MERPKPNKINLWWGKIGSKDEATRVIKGSYQLFYGIGFVFLAGGLFSTLDVLPAVRSFDAYLTGIIWTSLAFLLHRFYSRIRSGPGNLNNPISGESATVDGPIGR